MDSLGFYEWFVILLWICAAIYISYVIASEVLEATKHRRSFNQSNPHKPKIDVYDPCKDVYDWKKDAPNDFR